MVSTRWALMGVLECQIMRDDQRIWFCLTILIVAGLVWCGVITGRITHLYHFAAAIGIVKWYLIALPPTTRTR